MINHPIPHQMSSLAASFPGAQFSLTQSAQYGDNVQLYCEFPDGSGESVLGVKGLEGFNTGSQDVLLSKVVKTKDTDVILGMSLRLYPNTRSGDSELGLFSYRQHKKPVVNRLQLSLNNGNVTPVLAVVKSRVINPLELACEFYLNLQDKASSVTVSAGESKIGLSRFWFSLLPLLQASAQHLRLNHQGIGLVGCGDLLLDQALVMAGALNVTAESSPGVVQQKYGDVDYKGHLSAVA